MEPWCMDDYFLVLNEMDNNDHPSSVSLIKAGFWVRAYEVLFEWMTRQTSITICKMYWEVN